MTAPLFQAFLERTFTSFVCNHTDGVAKAVDFSMN